MNGMYDLTQFVVSSITDNIEAAAPAQFFMSDIVMTFGMCAVVVIDNSSTSKCVFILMCKHLKIQYWCLLRGNQRGNGNSVERHQSFLNKTQTLVGTDRGTSLVIVQHEKKILYAWNSAPIDNIGISRSLATVGREFRFLLDVELSQIPQIN